MRIRRRELLLGLAATGLAAPAFAQHDGGTRATYTSTFESAEALQKVLDMGVIEGTSLAINQIDDLVAS